MCSVLLSCTSSGTFFHKVQFVVFINLLMCLPAFLSIQILEDLMAVISEKLMEEFCPA